MIKGVLLMNKYIKFVFLMVMSVTMLATMSACLPDEDLGDKTERTQLRREAQATGLARSLSVVGTRVFSSFTSDASSPFVIASLGAGVDSMTTQEVDFETTFAMNLGPAGDKVKAGYCSDSAAGANKSFIVWLSDEDASGSFMPKGLGEGASGAVMAELSNMSDPSSVGYVSSNRINLQDGQELSLGTCASDLEIPTGSPVMIFANIQAVNTMAENTTRTETRTIACSGGQTGTITQKRDVVIDKHGVEVTPLPAWTVATDLCSDTVSKIASAEVSADTADILGSGGAIVGALPDGVLKDLLGGLENSDCVSGATTTTTVDGDQEYQQTASYDSCEGDNLNIEAIDGLVSVPVGNPYEDGPLYRACSSSTLGESNDSYTTTSIPSTGNASLTGVWSSSVWGPNNGASYTRTAQDYSVTHPDGQTELITSYGPWVGDNLDCQRTERVVFEVDDFAPIWSSMGVDPNNISTISDNGVVYTRMANVDGWNNPNNHVPNSATYTPWVLGPMDGQWNETVRTDIVCPMGEPGVETSTRTHTLTGYRTVSSSAWVTGDTCGGAVCLTDNSGRKSFNNPVTATWAGFSIGESSRYTGPGGRLMDNCPSGYTATELTDDPGERSIGEDKEKAWQQLCLKTSQSDVVIKSEWRPYSCSSGMVDTGVRDSNGNSNKSSDHYRHAHNLDEEDNATNYYHWCLGLDDPSGESTLTITRPWSSTCPSDTTFIVNASGNEWNLNNEDGPNNRSLCVKVSSIVEDRVSCPITGPWDAGSWGACSASCGGGTRTRTVTCPFDSCTGTQPASSQSCNTQSCTTYSWHTGGWGACTATPTSGPWSTGSWGSCSASCGGGTQTRSVTCPFDSCTGSQPVASQSCNTQACAPALTWKLEARPDGYNYEWSQCQDQGSNHWKLSMGGRIGIGECNASDGPANGYPTSVTWDQVSHMYNGIKYPGMSTDVPCTTAGQKGYSYKNYVDSQGRTTRSLYLLVCNAD